MDFNNYTLIEIIEGCKKNDHISQTKLYNMYRTKMSYYVLKIFNNNNDDDFIDHVLSMSFSRVFQKIHQFNYQGSFEGWIRVIVRGEIYTHLKANKNYKDRYCVMDVFKYIEEENEHKRLQNNVFVDKNPNGSDDLIMKEYFDYIETSLTPREFTVFKRNYEGFTHKEISKDLNIAEGTVKWYMNKARIKLRKSFKIQFGFKLQDSEL